MIKIVTPNIFQESNKPDELEKSVIVNSMSGTNWTAFR